MFKLLSHAIGLGRKARFALWIRYAEMAGRRKGVRVNITVGDRPIGIPRLTFTRDGEGGSLTMDLGDQVVFGRGSRIDVASGRDSAITVGPQATFHESTRVHLAGANVEIGSRFQLRPFGIIHAYGHLTIGDDVMISFGAIIHCGTRVILRDRSGYAERVSIVDSDHTTDGTDIGAYRVAPTIHEPVDIGENTLVFANTVIMRGVTIGKNSSVAASSVVKAGTYPDSSLIAGAPAEVKRNLRAQRAPSG